MATSESLSLSKWRLLFKYTIVVDVLSETQLTYPHALILG